MPAFRRHDGSSLINFKIVAGLFFITQSLSFPRRRESLCKCLDSHVRYKDPETLRQVITPHAAAKRLVNNIKTIPVKFGV
jgi:hypothetical protein